MPNIHIRLDSANTKQQYLTRQKYNVATENLNRNNTKLAINQSLSIYLSIRGGTDRELLTSSRKNNTHNNTCTHIHTV